MDHQNLEWNEYLIFIVVIGLFLMISARFFLKKTNTLAEVVWGSDRIGILPITLSLFATSISSVAASVAAEYYQYGINVIFEIVAIIVNGIFILMQAPVLFPLKFVSVNEYFVLRFNGGVKNFMAMVILISQVIYATVVCFTLAVQAESILQINLPVCFTAAFFFCFALSALGGFEGVVWTDSLQALIMVVSSILISVVACTSVGGLGKVYGAARDTGRLTIDFSLDPTKRLTSWTAAMSFMPMWLSFSSLFSPAMYQRYVTLGKPFLRKAVAIVAITMTLFKLLICFFGLTIYAYYHGCDPVASSQIDKYDQILPLFIGQIGRTSSFFRGMYNIGFFCSGVSTMTTTINTCGIVVYRDFVEKMFNKAGDVIRAKILIILIQFAMFIISILIFLSIQSGDNITELVPLYGTPTAIYASAFTLGMFVPMVNSKGVLVGSLMSLPLSFLLTWGSKSVVNHGLVKYPMQPMSVERCPFNVTMPAESIISTYFDPDIFPLFKLSPFLNPVVIFASNCVICIVASHIFKVVTGGDQPVDAKLISPLCRRFVSTRESTDVELRAAGHNEALSPLTGKEKTGSIFNAL